VNPRGQPQAAPVNAAGPSVDGHLGLVLADGERELARAGAGRRILLELEAESAAGAIAEGDLLLARQVPGPPQLHHPPPRHHRQRLRQRRAPQHLPVHQHLGVRQRGLHGEVSGLRLRRLEVELHLAARLARHGDLLARGEIAGRHHRHEVGAAGHAQRLLERRSPHGQAIDLDRGGDVGHHGHLPHPPLLLVAGARGELDLLGLEGAGVGEHLLERVHRLDGPPHRRVHLADVEQRDLRGDELLRAQELGQRARVVVLLVELLAPLVALARLAARRIGGGGTGGRWQERPRHRRREEDASHQ
jgi:hypothetical protein